MLYKNERLVTEFIFTIPLLPKGDYFLCASFARNMQQHTIINWINDAYVLKSNSNNVAAGFVGVPMHSIKIRKQKNEE